MKFMNILKFTIKTVPVICNKRYFFTVVISLFLQFVLLSVLHADNQSASSRAAFTRGSWIGANNISMGTAVEAISADVFSIYWNPAGLTQLRYRKQNINEYVHEKLKDDEIDDISERDLALYSDYSPKPFLQFGSSVSMLSLNREAAFSGAAFNIMNLVIAPGVYYIRSDDIEKRNESGTKTGYADYGAGVSYLSFAYPLDFISLGVTGKALYENIDSTTYYGGGADFGIQADFIPLIGFGVVMQDLVQTMRPLEKSKYISDDFDFSSPQIRMNVSVSSRTSDIIISFGLVRNLEDSNYSFKLGFKYDLTEFLNLAVGLNDSQFSSGVNLKIWQLDLSYAVSLDKIDMGYNNTVSVKVIF